MSRWSAGDDDEILQHYGTPLVDEEELRSRRKGKVVIEKGQARRVAPWKQEVTDSEGRRRFHGAFTGGFSAGFYNTVGSKEGWAPSSFVSSRSQRVSKTEQKVYDFLDDDEKEELKSKQLESSTEYDVLGFTSTDLARRAANKEYANRPSAIPGGVPDEIIIPIQHSIGEMLLMKMGWRQGFDGDANRFAVPTAVHKGHGLGLEALEDLDRGNEDEEIYSRFVVEDEDEAGSQAKQIVSKSKGVGRTNDSLPSFVSSSHSSANIHPERFPPPLIPRDFTAKHVSAAPFDIEKYRSKPEPPECLPPDPEMVKAITGVAALVAKTGLRVEEVLKQKHATDRQFTFLFEKGFGHDFYVRRLWEEQRLLGKERKITLQPQQEVQRTELIGMHRGRILGEKPLPEAERDSGPSSERRRDMLPLVPTTALSELTAQMKSRFTGGGVETTQKLEEVMNEQADSRQKLTSLATELYQIPRREEGMWRPSSILCKRFNLPDPRIGSNLAPLRPTLGVDAFILAAQASVAIAEPSRAPQPKAPVNVMNELASEDVGEIRTTETTIDLYKAIFSDDEDDGDQSVSSTAPRRHDFKSKAFSKKDSAADNYTAAGDFLESLGKELGLRV